MELFRIQIKDYTQYLNRMIVDRGRWATAYAKEIEAMAPKGLKRLFGEEKRKHEARLKLLDDVQRGIGAAMQKFSTLNTCKNGVMMVDFSEYAEILSYMNPDELAEA